MTSTQKPLPGMDDEHPTSYRRSGRGIVSASVRRTYQLQDNTWVSFAAAVELPPTATPEQVARAIALQATLLKGCYDEVTRSMLEVLPYEAGRATIGQIVALTRTAQQLGLTEDALSQEANALGIAWPEEGATGLSFTEITRLQDVLVPQLRAQQGGKPGEVEAVPPAEEELTLQNVWTVPVERLLRLVVHFGKPKEAGGQKGMTLEEVWQVSPQRLAWIGNMDGTGWEPKPNPTTGQMDPQDAVLQAAAVRLYRHLMAEKRRGSRSSRK